MMGNFKILAKVPFKPTAPPWLHPLHVLFVKKKQKQKRKRKKEKKNTALMKTLS